jgi:hypothetical protein
MQETKVEDAKFPAADIAALGYTVSFRGSKQYNGVAIATRQKPAEVFFGLAGEPADPDRLAGVRLGDLVVLNAYVPQGQEVDKPQFAYKLAWLGRLKAFSAKKLPDRPEARAVRRFSTSRPSRSTSTIRSGFSGTSPSIRRSGRLYEDLASWGLVDVFRGIIRRTRPIHVLRLPRPRLRRRIWAGASITFWPHGVWAGGLRGVLHRPRDADGRKAVEPRGDLGPLRGEETMSRPQDREQTNDGSPGALRTSPVMSRKRNRLPGFSKR